MLSFPGLNRRRNRRHLNNLQESRIAQQTVLQVNQVVFADGSSVGGAGGNLDTEVTNNTQSNEYQFIVTDRGITDALEDITAENVTVNENTITNVNIPADWHVGLPGDMTVSLSTDDQLPHVDAWHNVTPLDSSPPNQNAGSFVYAKSATPISNNTVYGIDQSTVSGQSTGYLEIKEPGVYEMEADMYWVSAATQLTVEKTIATQLYISRVAPDTQYSDYSGIGPVSTCFMFGNVRMGSTSVSTVTQCAAGDRVRVMAVGTLAGSNAPAVTSPAGRSSLRVRRISNHYNGHLSYYVNHFSASNVHRTFTVHRGLPEGVPGVRSPALINFDYAGYMSHVSPSVSIAHIDAHTWISGARDYYIKLDPPFNQVGDPPITLTKVSLQLVDSSGNFNETVLINETVVNDARVRTEHPSREDYLELLSGTYDDGLVRFKCGPGLNANDLKAGILVATTVTPPPDGYLEFNFS